MRKLAVFTVVGAVLLVGAVPAFRLLTGVDLKTGKDPRIAQAALDNQGLEIEAIRKTTGLYMAQDRISGLTGYFQLQDGEALTGAMRVSRCGEAAAGGLARFPAGSDWVCIRTATTAGEWRQVSFITRAAELENAFAFYAGELKRMATTSGAESRQSGQRWDAQQFRMNDSTGRKLSIRYFHEPGIAGPFVSILDTDAR